MKTYSPKPRDIERRWYVIDATGAVLGRLATQAAAILRGKHKPIFAPHMDTGDHVIVVNAKEIRLTGGKETKKVAYRHSGYPGGLTATTYAELLAAKPAFAVEKAIKGMLPKNRLGRAMAGKLKVYAGPTHRHQAQQPQPLALGEVPRWDGLPKAGTRTGKPGRPDEPAGAAAGRTAKPEPKAPGAAKAKTAAKPAKAKTAAEPAKVKTAAEPARSKPAARRTKKEE